MEPTPQKRTVLFYIDCVAVAIALFAGMLVFGDAVSNGLNAIVWQTKRDLVKLWSTDQVICIVVLVCAVWIALRRKIIKKRLL